jgi:hypothetical protein
VADDVSTTMMKCQQIHLVNRVTGEILEEEDEDEAP